jgi:gas vesicle protein GvpG
MGLLTAVLTAPFAPVRGVVAVAEQIRRQAEEEFYDPVTIRTQLEAIDAARASGELSEDEATAREDALVERLMIGQQLREERHG